MLWHFIVQATDLSMSSFEAPEEITLPPRLERLVKYCEKNCVADCCGIDAFDFSPLHVASYLSSYTGGISESEFSEWEQELDRTLQLITDLPSSGSKWICSIKSMNQYFTSDTFNRFIAELRHSIRSAPKVLELSERLRNDSILSESSDHSD